MLSHKRYNHGAVTTCIRITRRQLLDYELANENSKLNIEAGWLRGSFWLGTSDHHGMSDRGDTCESSSYGNCEATIYR